MASWNAGYLGTLPGLVKTLSILFLVIAMGLGGHAFNKSLFNTFVELFRHEVGVNFPDDPDIGREEFFLSVVGILLILSSLSLFAHMLNESIAIDLKIKFADILYHILGAIFLIVAGSLMIASARSISKGPCVHWANETTGWTELEGKKCHYRTQKDFAGVFGIFGGFIFGFLALLQLLRFHHTENSAHGVVE